MLGTVAGIAIGMFLTFSVEAENANNHEGANHRGFLMFPENGKGWRLRAIVASRQQGVQMSAGDDMH